MTGNASSNSVFFSQMQSTEHAEPWSLSFLFPLAEIHISKDIRERPRWQVCKCEWHPFMVSKECMNDPFLEVGTAGFPVLY